MACAEALAHSAISLVNNVVLSEGGSVELLLLMKRVCICAHQTLSDVGYTLSSAHSTAIFGCVTFSQNAQSPQKLYRIFAVFRNNSFDFPGGEIEILLDHIKSLQ